MPVRILTLIFCTENELVQIVYEYINISMYIIVLNFTVRYPLFMKAITCSLRHLNGFEQCGYEIFFINVHKTFLNRI